jgi:alkanesulfonate monooxygenase SsuD/methylene tetrahydromethanopterin reductase-like flavin-dependent oxidoreductase (luciferase family)
MRSFPIGVMLPLNQQGPERTTARWTELRAMALRAEELGFDTVWTPDELLWLHEDAPPQGVWEGVAMAGAVAAVTSTVTVGTWVLSALHRNAGITAKVAETLDEIAGGRFIFGLGAGHTWPGQAHAFGLPEDDIFARFGEALRIIVPLMREGRVDYEGTYHVAHDLQQNPVGPRPGAIPLLIGGNGPKGQRHAVRHAEIWSGWIENEVSVEDMAAKIALLEAICEEEGRDPATIGRSIGVVVDPTAPSGERPDIVSGSAQQIADTFRAFQAVGFTRLEMMFRPGTVEGIEALGRVLEAFDAG